MFLTFKERKYENLKDLRISTTSMDLPCTTIPQISRKLKKILYRQQTKDWITFNHS